MSLRDCFCHKQTLQHHHYHSGYVENSNAVSLQSNNSVFGRVERVADSKGVYDLYS